ncbi:hypothetical protein QBC47DRAFT_357820 [Echria macrotheca]|uniref:Protein kinase domain-containing protein n=1 Tax=Echria macrotheca TaxID=438768 RepID=A0AAJ0BKM5_9PEZI|nr:hypothetical protein QBC47DRAFT_357820 [Echria macrotheca]
MANDALTPTPRQSRLMEMGLPNNNPGARILGSTISNVEDDPNEYCIINGDEIKRITVDGSLISVRDRTFIPTVLSVVPPFPSGNWNTGYVDRDCRTGKAVFSSMRNVQLGAAQIIWHPGGREFAEFQYLRPITAQVSLAWHPCIGLVILKIADCERVINNFVDETNMYGWIEGHDIGPRFLGHLMDHGIPFGIILEYIKDARQAEPKDLKACQKVLDKLHSLGIRHSDIQTHFLIRKNGDAVLISFSCATQNAPKDDLEAESQQLVELLQVPYPAAAVSSAVLGGAWGAYGAASRT